MNRLGINLTAFLCFVPGSGMVRTPLGCFLWGEIKSVVRLPVSMLLRGSKVEFLFVLSESKLPVLYFVY